MIKAVLIDVDNTLLDFDEYVKYAMKRGMEEFQNKRRQTFLSVTFLVFITVYSPSTTGSTTTSLPASSLLARRISTFLSTFFL